ncbi:helix-turn-helix domain-containing protein [Streptomyces hiroshimensis]|uniref:helix-turn-helix domain-containing protein n=1 Tax=Streptomyces hiroshimensis TaxID=66424 RepID=UPI001E2F69C8|nr:helix-turn-helix transcriptional regulator [Streptomyces hiroshimensis]
MSQSKFGWGFFGTELRRRREAAELTQQELGRRVFCSGAYIGQFETGIRKPQPDIAARIDAELGTDGYFARMCEELINNSPYASCFVEAAYLEGLAVTIREYAPTFMPGVLQTAAYARAVFLGFHPFVQEDALKSWVDARLERARILDRSTDPLFWAVLDEGVIRRRVGGTAVMHEQLMHVISLVRKRRIGVQVLPYEAGVPALGGMVSFMTFDDSPPVVYEEGHQSGSLLDDPVRVAQSERSYGLVRSAALSPEASLFLIESAAREYADDH